MPPRFATWLAGFRLHPEEREFALGDLAEEFLDRTAADGLTAARRWYWRQAIRSCFTRQPRRYRHSAFVPKEPAMKHLVPDVRFALRLLRRSPGFTAVVVITLALGIGATTAIFSIVHAALLKPLPFKDPQTLVVPMYGTSSEETWPMSYSQFVEWRDSFGVFEELAAYFNWNPTLQGLGEAEALYGLRSSASLFSILGVEPVAGRLFTKADEPREAEPVVMISERLWRQRFNADREIAGRRIVLSDQTFTVVGVLPASFAGVRPEAVTRDVVTPLRLNERLAPPTLRFLSTIARLKAGQTPGVAQEALQAAVLRAQPDAQPQPRVVVLPVRDRLIANGRGVLLALMGAVGFLLLITCANLANLLLSRGVARRREIAVRFAVGASRPRIATQLLTESIILSLMGGAIGLLLAWLAVRVAAGLPVLATAGIYTVSIDWVVLGFTAGVSILVGLLFGLMPALRAGRTNQSDLLRDGARVAGGRDLLRSSFVVAEVALTVILLAGAALLGRSLANLISVDKGFGGDSVVTFGLSTSPRKYPTGPDWVRYFETVLERIARIPGVESVGLVNEIPLGSSDTNGGVPIEGRTFPPGEGPVAQKRIVSPAYFATLGIPVKRGRGFEATDTAGGAPVIVVSESFATRWFPDEDPIGKKVGFAWDMAGFQTVVGVVGDVKHNGLDDEASPAVYVTIAQRPDMFFTIAARTGAAPESLLPAIRDEVRAIDPDRPMTDVRTMTQIMATSVGARRLSLNLVTGFALIGLLLATTGIYGVVSHVTQQRSREFGIRLALGAERGSVLRLVLRHGVTLALMGVAIGVIGALLLGGVIRAQLFGIEPSDPVTLAAVCGVLAMVALGACYLPARRAVRINPASVLRE
jgi:putative ABC transport system permease protein